MTFEKYIQDLQEFLEKNPTLATAEVVYAKDAEGNGFDKVCLGPSAGFYESGEFAQESEEVNAVCIN